MKQWSCIFCFYILDVFIYSFLHNSPSLQWIDPKEELDDEATCEALVTSRKALYARQLIEKMEEMKLEEEIQQNVKVRNRSCDFSLFVFSDVFWSHSNNMSP